MSTCLTFDPKASENAKRTYLRIERLEQALDLLCREALAVCGPGNNKWEFIDKLREKSRSVTRLIRGFRDCLDMRADLHLREKIRQADGTTQRPLAPVSTGPQQPSMLGLPDRKEKKSRPLSAAALKKNFLNNGGMVPPAAV